MSAMIIRHRVADFDKWLEAYEAHMDVRKTFGAAKSMVWQDVADDNNVFVYIKFEDLGRAREFAASENLKQVMQTAGVIEEPSIHYVENGRQFDG